MSIPHLFCEWITTPNLAARTVCVCPEWQTNGQTLTEQIRKGSYQPSPIKGVEIPKSNGKTRMLGIPTLTDRVFQQALHQVLEPVFEPDFQRYSYGFRPNRNAKGRTWCVLE
ncbi:MAG: hypothetical protein EA360_11940 [Balneolaceae bacterium]|nr:MAG: hypothetical protein EA360_11940 [Balneolaceae bacterium]